MLRRVIRSTYLAAFAFVLAACSDDKPGPAVVDPSDTSAPSDARPVDGVAPGDTATPADTVAPADTAAPDTRPGAGADVSGIWVVDNNGVDVGLLVRRGSDDATAGRAIYDFVTVFHPDSELFFEITMTDAVVRYPANTFFEGYSCDVPIGIGVGPCQECRSAWGLGILHAGRWYKVRGGAAWETRGPGSVLKGGIATECVAHGTANAKVFVVDPVTGAQPPASFAPPLRFSAR